MTAKVPWTRHLARSYIAPVLQKPPICKLSRVSASPIKEPIKSVSLSVSGCRRANDRFRRSPIDCVVIALATKESPGRSVPDDRNATRAKTIVRLGRLEGYSLGDKRAVRGQSVPDYRNAPRSRSSRRRLGANPPPALGLARQAHRGGRSSRMSFCRATAVMRSTKLMSWSTSSTPSTAPPTCAHVRHPEAGDVQSGSATCCLSPSVTLKAMPTSAVSSPHIRLQAFATPTTVDRSTRDRLILAGA